MNNRKTWFLSSLIVTFCTIILLVFGSSLLTVNLAKSNTIPLGTFITWAGMVSLPLTIYFGIGELRKPTNTLNRFLSKFHLIIIILAFLWLPISYLLAGNISFSFSEKETFQGGQVAMRWFWRLSYGIAIGAILTLIIFWVSLLFKKKKTVAKNV